MPESLLATVLSAARPVAVCLWYALACYGLGTWLLRTVRGGRSGVQATAQVPLDFLFGASVLALICSLGLTFEIYRAWWLACLVAASSLAGLAPLWSAARASWSRLHVRPSWGQPCDWQLWILIMSVVGAMGFTILFGFMPLEPNGDAAAFYMVLPKLLVYEQRAAMLPGYEAFSLVGWYGEYHFAALMSLGAGTQAKLFTWVVGVACATLLAAMSRRLGGKRLSWWLVYFLVYSSSAFYLLIGDGKVDLFAAALACAVFYSLMDRPVSSSFAFGGLVGFLTGQATVAKMSYLPILVPSLMLFVVWSSESERFSFGRLRIVWTPIVVGAVLGLSFPLMAHCLKNYALIGEPFAPFFYFKGNPFPGEWANQSWFARSDIVKIILTYPLSLTFGQFPMQYGTLSLFLLGLAPALLARDAPGSRRPRMQTALILAGCLGVGGWVVLRPGVFAPRYILYAVLLLIPPIAVGYERLMDNVGRRSWMPRMLTAFLALYASVAGYMMFQEYRGRIRLATSHSEVVTASEALSRASARGARVLSWNYFTYWVRPDLLGRMSTSQEARHLESVARKAPQDLLITIEGYGYHYILVDLGTHGWLYEALIRHAGKGGQGLVEHYRGAHYALASLGGSI